jgi:hypothetical protein
LGDFLNPKSPTDSAEEPKIDTRDDFHLDGGRSVIMLAA